MGIRPPRPARGQRHTELAQRLAARVSPPAPLPRSARGVARTAARATLWAGVGLVLVHGVGDILASPHEPPRRAAVQPSAPSFPNDEARAFAVDFASTYLTTDAGHAEHSAAHLSPYLATSLSDQATPSVSPRSPGAAVAEATVARVVPLSESRALITVAVLLRNGRTRYLTVPVARDDGGGLVVYDLPSFSAPPVAGVVQTPTAIPLSGSDGDAVADLTRRFLRAYLHGEDESALAYFLAPGTHVAPIGPGLTVEAVEEVDRLDGSTARGMQVIATARVREDATGTTYEQRYRITVARRDRWYIAGVAGAPGS